MITNLSPLSRRAFLRAAFHVSLGVAAAGLYTTLVEPEWLAVDRVRLALPRLPKPFAGYTIAQISDLHLS